MPLRLTDRLFSALAVLLGAVLFVLAVGQLGKFSPPGISEEMQVALPRFVQVILSAGDRFLAANVASFRAIVASTENMREDNFRVQAQVQQDAAWLNPAHEDNYYVAAAILPWNGEFDAGQHVLQLAMRARPYDWQPAFYYAFNLYFLRQDPVAAADALLKAAPGVRSESSRMTMEALAYAWYEKGYDPEVALSVVEESAHSARTGALRRYLEARAGRLRGLLTLRRAAETFVAAKGRRPTSLDELRTSGMLRELPVDPLGIGYELSSDGQPVIRNRRGGR